MYHVRVLEIILITRTHTKKKVFRLFVDYLPCPLSHHLIRQVKESDLVLPSAGRAVANELGLPYYEASVLTYFGVSEVFDNAIRAALCLRRQQRFWTSGHLKRISNPILQVCTQDYMTFVRIKDYQVQYVAFVLNVGVGADVSVVKGKRD